MKIFLWVLGLVAFYLVVEFSVFYYKYNQLPNLQLPDQSDKILGSGPALRYIAAGDSTAVGEGASSLEKTYTYQLAEYFAQSHTVDYKNVAVVGSKTSDVLKNQVSQIIAYRPDIITISIGGNDATHLISAYDILNNYKNIISQLEKQTTAKIYITNIPQFNSTTIFPWFYVKLLEYRSSKINSQILALGNARVKIIDIHNFGWSQFKDITKTSAADGFHPNDLGYQNWTAAFVNAIKN